MRCPLCGRQYQATLDRCPYDGASLDATAEVEAAPAGQHDPLIGQRVLDTYQVLRRIGTGCERPLYEARDLDEQRNVALQVMSWPSSCPREAWLAFIDRARAVAQLRHPNAIEIFDVVAIESDEADALYIVHELARGPRLLDVLTTRGALDPSTVLTLLKEVCSAVGAAHLYGVMHGDLSPQNVLLAETRAALDDVKVHFLSIQDHAWALLNSGDGKVPRERFVHLAPEQLSGDPADELSDIYGIGCLAYAMLCGHEPLGDDPRATSAPLHPIEPIPPPSQRRKGAPLPDGLDAIVLRCLSKRREERYASVAQLAEALGQLPAGAVSPA